MAINSVVFILADITRIDSYAYCSPFVVMGAAGIIMWCAQLKIKYSKVINFIAKSSFAVFLFHTNPNIGEPVFRSLMQHFYNSFNGMTCLAVIFVILVLIFVLAVALDQPRKWLWNKLICTFSL